MEQAAISIPEVVNTVLQGGVTAGFLWFVLSRLEKTVSDLTDVIRQNSELNAVKLTDLAAAQREQTATMGRLADAVNARYIGREPRTPTP